MGVAGHIDQDIAQRAVNDPWRHVLAMLLPVANDLAQCDLQLIDLVVPRLVHTRGLAGGADEHPAEQIAQTGVVVPIKDEAGQQFGAAQKRTIGRRGPAHHHVVTATGAGVAAIGHELFGRQTRLDSGLVQKFGVVHQLGPVVRRVDVDLDHARIGRDLQQFQTRVTGRRVAFEDDLNAQLSCGGFDGAHQCQVIFEARQRWHEDIKHAGLFTLGHGISLRFGAVGAVRVSHFHAQGGAHHRGIGLELGRGLLRSQCLAGCAGVRACRDVPWLHRDL